MYSKSVSDRASRKQDRERNQQDAANLMFIIHRLSQHVSGIIMPIIRRTRLCTTKYGVTVLNTICSSTLNTICSSTQSYSPDDGHNDARNMLR